MAILLEFIILKKLNEALNLGCLKEAYEIKMVAHEDFLVTWHFGYH